MASDERVHDNLEQLLEVLPPRLRTPLLGHPHLEELLEIVMDLGRPAEARFSNGFEVLTSDHCTGEDLDYVLSRVGEFDRDNRAGLERTLHRISAVRNRRGEIIGLTCRVGRAVQGTIDIIRDIIEEGKSLLLLGRPGVGKTTRLREVARVLADEFSKRVIVVDTNNEIAGDADIPHPGIGHARRMQVPSDREQAAVMIEAVENHMPEVIVIDEIGTDAEAAAARTIAERGVQLVGTAHGNDLANLLSNPILMDLVGGVQAVVLSDEEARRRRTQKTVLERKAPPTFDTVIEIQSIDSLTIHRDVASAVDAFLQGRSLRVEVRYRDRDGGVKTETQSRRSTLSETMIPEEKDQLSLGLEEETQRISAGRIYPHGISRRKLETVLEDLNSAAVVARHPWEADIILALESRLRREPIQGRPDAQILTVRSNTHAQIKRALLDMTLAAAAAREAYALQEAREAVERAVATGEPVELLPQNSYVRRMQHELVAQHDLISRSVGQEPRRRVRVMVE